MQLLFAIGKKTRQGYDLRQWSKHIPCSKFKRPADKTEKYKKGKLNQRPIYIWEK